MSHYILDARRLLCPLPVIRVQDRVTTLKEGELLEVMCTDHGVLHDIPAWCRINGHEVVEIREAEGELAIVVRVGTDRAEHFAASPAAPDKEQPDAVD